MKNTAVLLAAGSGSRMKSDVKKQYMLLGGKPVIFYSLKTFQESFIDDIVLVCSPGDAEYCDSEIVRRYGFDKVSAIVEGGEQRYHSVFNGVKKAFETGSDIIYIHDGARAFLTAEILERCRESVKETGACIAAMPSKDTIKVADSDSFVESTPDRARLWNVQTPQVFEAGLIKECYERLVASERKLRAAGVTITDDSMAVELFSDTRVKLVEGSYENIKITTPEDMILGERLLTQGAESL